MFILGFSIWFALFSLWKSPWFKLNRPFKQSKSLARCPIPVALLWTPFFQFSPGFFLALTSAFRFTLSLARNISHLAAAAVLPSSVLSTHSSPIHSWPAHLLYGAHHIPASLICSGTLVASGLPVRSIRCPLSLSPLGVRSVFVCIRQGLTHCPFRQWMTPPAPVALCPAALIRPQSSVTFVCFSELWSIKCRRRRRWWLFALDPARRCDATRCDGHVSGSVL